LVVVLTGLNYLFVFYLDNLISFGGNLKWAVYELCSVRKVLKPAVFVLVIFVIGGSMCSRVNMQEMAQE
jgi:hypothetical protein